jgi:hypothetical protein
MPVNYRRDYPATWPEIRGRIMARDQNRCRQCGVKNHLLGFRDGLGMFSPLSPDLWRAGQRTAGGYKVFKIILTCAHLDHDKAGQPEYHDDDNLAMLCQMHHLQLDAPYKAKKRKERHARNQ